MAKNERHMELARKAVKHFGTQQMLADEMAKYQPSVRQGHVNNWVMGNREVSPYMAVAMEQAAPSVVTREEFHPGLYI